MKTFTCLLAAAAFAFGAPALADPTAPQALVEDFNDIAQLNGWYQLNRSAPPGNGWFQGNEAIFEAHAGAPDSYIAANFLSAGSDSGTVDLWLVTPVVDFRGQLSFHLRSAHGPGFNDTIEVLFGLGGSTNPDNFHVLMDSLRPGSDWTRYQFSSQALGAGRFAFRYTGQAATANYIGLDTLQVGLIPEPASWAMLCAGVGLIGVYRRRAALLVAGAALLAGPALAASPAQEQAAAPGAGAIVVKDPQTGRLRPPTAAEYKALARLAQPLPGARGMAAPPATIKRADGTVQRRLGDAGLTYSVISRDKDGKLRIDCAQGEDAAQQAMQPGEDGYEDR